MIARRTFLNATLAAATGSLLRPAASWADAATLPATLTARGRAGGDVSLTAAELTELRGSLHGALLLAADSGYDAARKYWDSAFDRHPALIVMATTPADVVAAVQFARQHDLLTAVRAGGHCQSAKITSCDGALMINLTGLREVEIDVPGRRIRAQGGTLLGQVDSTTQASGLATTMGTATDTGIAGLTLGGGIGRLMRPLGLAVDNVVSAQIVTADGQLRRLSAADNPDLFWAIRGGAGNFGVVTQFEYQLHRLDPMVLVANGSYPYEHAVTVLKAVTELAERMPDAMTLGVELENDERGRQVTWSAFFAGDPKAGERLLEPLLKLGKTTRSRMKAETYLEAQGTPVHAPLAVPQAPASYERHGFIHGAPTDEFFTELVKRFAHVPPTLECFATLGQFGGAVARVKPDATAYFNREATYGIMIGDSWKGRIQPAADQQAYREVWQGVEPFTRGYYINGDSEVLDPRVRATYGANYARLARIKAQYDPTNLFQLNANIKPERT